MAMDDRVRQLDEIVSPLARLAVGGAVAGASERQLRLPCAPIDCEVSNNTYDAELVGEWNPMQDGCT
jgi:hypothetical protein